MKALEHTCSSSKVGWLPWIHFALQGKVTISNDGATIMKLLDVVHPAAKVLVDISLSQDSEVQDHQPRS
jgi:hypothetical protein